MNIFSSLLLMSAVTILFTFASSNGGKITDYEYTMSHSVRSFRDIIGDEHGLTLIELMIVLVLSLFLMSAVYLTFQVQKQTSKVQQDVSAVQQDVRAVLAIMAKDARQAGCDPLMTGTPDLTSAQCGPAGMSFTMDLNGDGDVADTDEQVAYAYAGTSLTRNGVELSGRVTAFGLTYLDADDAAIPPTGGGGTFLLAAEADNVRSVRITITIRSERMDPDLNDFIRRTMTRQVKMRNLGLF
jgi:prepilin-type N-terminal cleavage/methylation domain-containing protein